MRDASLMRKRSGFIALWLGQTLPEVRWLPGWCL